MGLVQPATGGRGLGRDTDMRTRRVTRHGGEGRKRREDAVVCVWSARTVGCSIHAQDVVTYIPITGMVASTPPTPRVKRGGGRGRGGPGYSTGFWVASHPFPAPLWGPTNISYYHTQDEG